MFLSVTLRIQVVHTANEQLKITQILAKYLFMIVTAALSKWLSIHAELFYEKFTPNIKGR